MKALSVSSADVHRGRLILVNGSHPFCEEEGISALETLRGVKLERQATVLLNALMAEINGWSKIEAVSGWRSKAEQEAIFRDSVKENGVGFTSKYVAKPGHSEHQTGLAIDLGLKKKNIDFIRPDFPYKGICQAFRMRASLYGFIERYPEGKEPITGISHEPWHFRFVGMPHAAIMVDLNLTLEEYMTFISECCTECRPYPYVRKGCRVSIRFIALSPDEKRQVEIDSSRPYTVSGNNTDGLVITQWDAN